MSEERTILDKVKSLLGFTGTLDSDTAERLNTVIDLTSDKLKILLGSTTIPKRLEHIVVEVSLKRFNRIGSEGLKDHTVEGEQMIWASDNDFDEFANEIDLYCERQNKSRGLVHFL